MRPAGRRPWRSPAAVVAGCGGGTGGGGSDSSGGSPASGQGDVREGGSITIGISAQPDSLDPALAYTVAGGEALWLVYTPLLTYSHEEGAEGRRLIPGLAHGHAEGLRRRAHLQAHSATEPHLLRRVAVRASDFENSVKRVLVNQLGRHAVLRGHRRG